jgi:hypothetical protein
MTEFLKNTLTAKPATEGASLWALWLRIIL